MAVGDRTEKRLAGPTAMTTASAIISSPVTGFNHVVKQVVFTNTGGSEALLYVAIGTANTPGNRVLSALPIAAYDTIVWDTALVLYANESLQAYADRNGVNITVMGWEKQV